MTNKKRCISNLECPMDTKLDRVVVYDRKGAPNINISKSLCGLKWNSW